MQTDIDKQSIIEHKTAKIIEAIIKRQHLSRAEAIKLWYNSKTKKVTLDSSEWYLSTSRIYQELEMEQNNDPFWMLNPFD